MSTTLDRRNRRVAMLLVGWIAAMVVVSILVIALR
jgi:hypothetical protein